jgi:RNA polymerase sigma factor (sigma-70 family)
MDDDAELLRRYANDRSEEAFAELVRRHLNLVYAAALRLVGGDAHRAKDVAQSVFTDLARKATALSRHTSLTGWLYTSTRYAAAKAVRAEQRRQKYEREAQSMNDLLESPASEPNWDRLRPVLDDVMGELDARDREAVLLRFFEDRQFVDVGAAMRLTEDAARMRVERALERMRVRLERRGLTSTTAALAAILANRAVAAAPSGLEATVKYAALSGAAAGGGAFSFLAAIGMPKICLVIAGAVALTGAAGIAMYHEASTGRNFKAAGSGAQKPGDDSGAPGRTGNTLVYPVPLNGGNVQAQEAVQPAADGAEANNNPTSAPAGANDILKKLMEQRQLQLRADAPGPDDAETHYKLGLELARLGRLLEAVSQFGDALKLKPDYAEAHYDMALTLLSLNRVGEAKTQLEMFLRLRPGNEEAQQRLDGIQAAQP